MTHLIIEQLKEGFIFTDENDDKYAVPASMLSIRVKAYFGVTDQSKHRKKEITKFIAPPVVTGKDARQCPETQGNMTADSHSAGATLLSSSTEQLQSAGVTHTSESKEATLPKLGTPDNHILRPKDLKKKSFDYSGWSPGQYKSLSFWELPDGRVVLKYGGAQYYSTKDLVMQIPFPFPRGQFSKENGWSSTVEQAFKMYRRYLAETPDGNDGRCKAQKKSRAEINPVPQSSDSSASGVSHPDDPQGQPDGTCDDVSFDTCANNDPKICKFCVNESRYDDKRKIAARKPGAPLLKANMGV